MGQVLAVLAASNPVQGVLASTGVLPVDTDPGSNPGGLQYLRTEPNKHLWVQNRMLLNEEQKTNLVCNDMDLQLKVGIISSFRLSG